MGEKLGTESRKRGKRSAQKSAPRADRSKRLLDLVMLLLRAHAPVPFREIRTQFSSYKTANIEAGLRAFERDKADLLELGVPIRYVNADEDTSVEDGGYVIELKKYRLPEVHLSAEEVSALVLAASIARAVPGSGQAHICDLALRKLAFDFPEPDTPRSPFGGRGQEGEDDTSGGSRAQQPVLVHFPEGTSETALKLSDRFRQLESATRRRKRVSMEYKSASDAKIQVRDLDPYGLFYRDKSWLVVGLCHLRNDIRSFRLDRIAALSVTPKPKSPDFERPEDFDVRAYASRSPWTFRPRPSESVKLELRAEALSAANEDFGPGAIREDLEPENGAHAVVIRFKCGNPEFVVSRILAAKGAMRLLEGANCQEFLAAELAAIEALYP